MQMMDGRYAGKNLPDHTIFRIEALEAAVLSLTSHQDTN